MPGNANVLQFKQITKYFPGVKALDNISFRAKAGEVLAFLGENGAGKSTLLKILNGDYRPTGGEYLINGEQRKFRNPKEAIDAGVSVIYQERQVLMNLSVAENIFSGRLPSKMLGFVDKAALYEQTRSIIQEFNLDIDPFALVKDLSIAYQQMVEIMKAYSREQLSIIAFDEPTASLCESEIESLFGIIRKLRDEGKIIIYVTHRMKEIQSIADKVAIFKDGMYVGTVIPGEVSEKEMINMMIGRDLGDIFNELERNEEIGDTVLSVEQLTTDYVKDISFSLRKGEILGFSGLVGAGRTEIVRGLIGADVMKGGQVLLEGRRIRCRSPKEAMEQGIVLVPEDRKTQGILPNLDVGGNISVATLKKYALFGDLVNSEKESEVVEKGIRDFKVKTPSRYKKILELSGGNQQKTIIARWMSTDPAILILDEPTKGIDIGAKAEFYKMICDFAKKGISVILISSELPEIIGLSDRIIVLKSGKIAGEVLREDASEEVLLSLAMLDT
ncbi:MAG: sugar ABC transporter ATP-binding protein [Defluviitaleaceae bacterium]|nr:sugar ABC transporter ATP-binding protein [Defluviitaleaceae bacterium]